MKNSEKSQKRREDKVASRVKSESSLSNPGPNHDLPRPGERREEEEGREGGRGGEKRGRGGKLGTALPLDAPPTYFWKIFLIDSKSHMRTNFPKEKKKKREA